MHKIVADAVNRLIRRLSRSSRIVRFAGMVRDQATSLIGYHLAASPHPEDNGELWLLERVGRHVERFIDVGANQGDWSALLLSRSNATGIAVEAGAKAIERLRTCPLDRLTVVHAAAGDAAGGEATFYEEPDAGEMSSMTTLHTAEAVSYQVPLVTIDGLIADVGWDGVELVKIDTEGWDFHCLRGAEKALAAQQIQVVQFEYNRSWANAGSTLRAAFNFLEGYGYEVAALRSDGLAYYDYERFGELFRYSNFVAFTSLARSWLV